ncbi:energy-coupling factor transporter transmembrane protein EcfT [Paraeggerthella hongkongensis]|uniref:energy-coupling factor transporter transmembrane component T n=1 Tax=Paraeggerthella hominis TaxID=2897351 RepID=UPI001C0FAC82|nr:energy-coupling factor transporter transmembrane protein EcfT [Paraeggerthella hongkongensis]MCD2432927.1 energy-coupling factor transporter transmembrane protein EcfT [Paraeggerthella hominis]
MDQSFVLASPACIRYIDPRVKLVHVAIAGVLLFVVRSTGGILLSDAFMVVALLFFGLYGCAARLIAVTGALLATSLLLASVPGAVAAAAGMSVFIFFKFTPLAGVYFMMTKSVSPSELANALERLRLPRALTITLAVTLRFLPTIGQEVGAMRDSMRIRNIPLTVLNVLKAPLTMMEFVMVPLMMRFVKVAEELAAAACVRGIERPGVRGSLLEMRLRFRDFAYLGAVVGCAAFLACFESRMIS